MPNEQLGEYSLIRYERVASGVAMLTMCRPDRLNAYTPTMCREIVQALGHYHLDDDSRVLVLTGEGRGFCSGGDIRGDVPEFGEIGRKRLGTFRRLRRGPQSVNVTLHRLEKPVIAMVNGVAASGGLAFALMCDYRIACASARLGDPSGRSGMVPDEGGAWLFPRAMGVDRAMKMVWFHEMYDADEALRLGLVSEVVPDLELRERTLDFARALAVKAPNAVASAKWMIRRGLEVPFEISLGDAGIWAMWNNTQADAREGMSAFRERRAPDY
jgi:2-(1,2-epoxy-1,2-dihydrophenyl)acetyl-CoA isomerase